MRENFVAKDIINLSYNIDNLIKKYQKALSREDFYQAQTIYNRMQGMVAHDKLKMSEIALRQSLMYSRLGSLFYEADYLLKVIKNEQFKNFNARAVALRLSLFFNVYYETDCKEYYFDLFKSRGMDVGRESSTVMDSKWQKSIHFVEDDGFYKMGEAINQMTQGRPELAIDAINEVDEQDKNYTKAQNFKASLLVVKRQYDEAKANLMDLVDKNLADEETFRALYCLPNLSENEMEYLLNKLQRVKSKYSSDNLDCVEASMLISLNRSQEAILILNKVSSKIKFDESFLALKSRCYETLGDTENLFDTLKILYALYPRLAFVRLALIKMELGESISCIDYLKEHPSKNTIKEGKKYIVDAFKNDWQKTMDRDTAQFMLNLAIMVGDFNLLRAVCRAIYNSDQKDVVLDNLASVFVVPQDLQVLLQVVLEEEPEQEISVLRFAMLEKVQFSSPEFFKQKDINDCEKRTFLLSAYAQSATLAFFEGLDLNQLCEKSDEILKKLYDSNLDDFPKLKFTDNLSFLLLSYCYPEEESLLALFFRMPEQLKEDVLKFINN